MKLPQRHDMRLQPSDFTRPVPHFTHFLTRAAVMRSSLRRKHGGGEIQLIVPVQKTRVCHPEVFQGQTRIHIDWFFIRVNITLETMIP